MSSATDEPAEMTSRSPFSGCLILLTAVLVMVFLVVFSTYALFRQYAEIEKFTADKPVAIPVSELENRETAINRMVERLEAFRASLGGEAPQTLTLSAEDLNLAVAAFPAFSELKGTFYVNEITEHGLRATISFPLNGKPRRTRGTETGWISSDPRYLNAELIAQPRLRNREVVLFLDDIKVKDRTVPREFIEQMSPYRITERYLDDPLLGGAMAQLTRVELSDQGLVLHHLPGESPEASITDAQVDSGARRLMAWLGIAAVLFLIFASVIIFVGYRMKGRQNRSA